ncbi:MAG: transglutaminase family protein, partial [Caulobacteraceae bacterium]
IYKPGPWNGNRPFSYDHQAPRDGSDIETKMLANYLKTRLGNCVSMPALFLILADKIGLKVTLSTAPNHLFVRYIAPDGQVTNLETTSGGNPARDAWLRTVRPMSDRSVYTGAYLSTLTRREAIANLATTVVEDLMRQGRYEEVIQACDIILKNDARNIFCYYDNAVAYSRLQQVFVDKYQTYDAVPDELLPGYEMLVENERTAKEKAVDLGWERYPHPTLGMQ